MGITRNSICSNIKKFFSLWILGLWVCSPLKANKLPLQGLSSAIEVELPDSYIEKLKKVGSIKQLLFEGTRAVWLLGDSDLWRFDFLSYTMKKISLLSKEDKNQLLVMNAVGKQLYVLATDRLLVLRFDPEITEQYLFQKQSKALSHSVLNIKGKSVLGVAGSLFFEFNREDEVFVRTVQMSMPEEGLIQQMVSSTSQHVWMLSSLGLYQFSLQQNKLTRLFQNPSKGFSLGQQTPLIYIGTPYLLFMLDHLGNSLGSIPVANRRQLVLMHIDEKKHSFLFNDRVLEVHHLHSKQTFQYRLAIKQGLGIKGLRVEGTKVGFVLDGLPKIFQLSGSTAQKL